MSELSDLTLNFSLREKTGTSASKQIRAQGRIPAVLYGKKLTVPFQSMIKKCVYFSAGQKVHHL